MLYRGVCHRILGAFFFVALIGGSSLMNLRLMLTTRKWTGFLVKRWKAAIQMPHGKSCKKWLKMVTQKPNKSCEHLSVHVPGQG